MYDLKKHDKPCVMKREDLKLDEFLCFAIYSANQAMQRVARSAYKNIGLTYLQYLIMTTLWENGNQSVNEIGEKLFLESNTLTPVIKKLEVLKFLSRTRDPKDERKIIVSLTKKGEALQAKSKIFAKSVVEKTGLSQGEFKEFQKKIIKLRTHLNKS